MYDLKNKVAIVTGAARKRGLGRNIALRLSKEGADIIVVSRQSLFSGEFVEGRE